MFVLSGPSGAGKGTIIALVCARLSSIGRAVSCTTRTPRPGEIDGREYHFLGHGAFEEAVLAGKFLEWVHYSCNLYGTLHSEIDERLTAGEDVILEIELAGARAVRAARPEAIAVFIAPPSMAELHDRLRGRATESDADIAHRLHVADTEVAASHEFDYVVINDDAERAAAEVVAIIEERRRGT